MTRVFVDAFVEPGATAALSSSRLTNNHALVRLPGRSVGGRKIHWSLMNADDDSGDVVAGAASSRRRLSVLATASAVSLSESSEDAYAADDTVAVAYRPTSTSSTSSNEFNVRLQIQLKPTSTTIKQSIIQCH